MFFFSSLSFEGSRLEGCYTLLVTMTYGAEHPRIFWWGRNRGKAIRRAIVIIIIIITFVVGDRVGLLKLWVRLIACM